MEKEIITLTKETGKNKIEFLDRKNILISYVDKNNRQQKAKGAYKSSAYGVAGTGIYSQVNGPGIHFELKNSPVILDKLYLRKTVEFSKLPAKDFLAFIFNMDFNIAKSDIGFILQSKIELNRPAFDMKRE